MATFDPTQYVDSSGNPTDQSLVALAQSIKTVESSGNIHAVGKSGESGAYQWMPGNFAAGAKKFGFDPTDMSEENQNKVAYMQMAEMKSKGLQPYQIASSWNSGSPDNWQNHSGTNSKGVAYDTPKYVQNVMAQFTKAKGGTPAPQTDPSDPMGGKSFEELYSNLGASPQNQTADNQSAQESGALFPAVTGENPIMAGLKTLGNVLPSAYNFGKGVVSALNPINIVKNIAAIPGAFSALSEQQGGAGNALKAAGSEFLPQAYQQLVPAFGRDLISGDTEAAQRDVTNNPFGSIAPFIFAAEGGAKLADNAATASATDAFRNSGEGEAPVQGPVKPVTAFSDVINKPMAAAGNLVNGPVRAFGSFLADNAAKVGKYAFGQATGLEPSTIDTRIANPDVDMSTVSREGIASTVKDALDKKVEDLSDTGKSYQSVRAQTTPINVDSSFLREQIAKEAGVKFVDEGPGRFEGKIEASGSSAVRDPAEVAKLQKFFDFWQPYFDKGQMTPEEYLNMRQDLSDMSKFDNKPGRSGPLESTAKGLRANLNDTYRSQIKGLEDKDATFSTQKTELENLRNGILDKNGELKKGAPNAIANSLGKGKAAFASQLDEIVPGISKQIQILKMAEDFEHAAGTKVGTYTRSALGAGGLGAGLVTGNIPIIAASIAEMVLQTPEVADAVIKTYAKAKPLLQAVADKLRAGAGAVNNAPNTVPAKLQGTVFGRSQISQ